MIGYTEDYIMISFMGTNEIYDWLTNFCITRVGAFDGHIHEGFYKRAQTVPLDDILLLANGRRVYFVGHSLGGAVATLCTLFAMRQSPDVKQLKNIFCITFGTPLIGSEAVQKFISASRSNGNLQLVDHFMTIVNERDCVPGALNINLTLSKVQEKLNRFSSCFEIAAFCFQGLGRVKHIARSAASVINNVAENHLDFHPIGSYRFIEIENGVQKLTPVLTNYKEICRKLELSVAFDQNNIDSHKIHSYQFNLTCALQVQQHFDNLEEDRKRHVVSRLPQASSLFKAANDSKLLPSHLYKYFIKALEVIHLPEVTMLIRVRSQKEYQHLTSILFRMGVFRVICFASSYPVLVSSFYNSFPEIILKDYNKKTFEYVYSAPITNFGYEFPCSEQLRAIKNTETAKVPIFRCSIRQHYPYDVFMPPLHFTPEEILKKWENELEKRYIRHEDIRHFKGGIIVQRDRDLRARDAIITSIGKPLRIKKLKQERYENSLKVAALSPALFLAISTSKPVALTVQSFGNVIIKYQGQNVTITKFTEILADQFSAALAKLRSNHELVLKETLKRQEASFNELWSGFNIDRQKVSEIALEKQQTVLRRFSDELKAVYDNYWYTTSRREMHADMILNQEELSLAEISEEQQKRLEDLQKSHLQELQKLSQEQSSEMAMVQEKWELQRIETLKANQLSYIGQAALTGAAVGAVTALFINVAKETHNYFYKQKPLPTVLLDIITATGKGSLIGAVSGGVITAVETTAEILPVNSFMKGLLKGNGSLIASTIFFTVDALGTFYKWRNKEITTKEMMATLSKKTSQFIGMTAFGVIAGAALVATGVTGVSVALGTLIASLFGNFVGSKFGEWLDKYWIGSETEQLEIAYQTLDLPFGASIEVVGKKFRKLSLQYHEDRIREFPPDTQLSLKQKWFEINVAVETIRNEEFLKNLDGENKR